MVVEGAGDDDDFESGSRLGNVADDAVSARFGRGRCRAGIIRGIGRQRGQSEDFARARTNHNPGNTDGGVFLHGFGEGRLDDVLDNRINGQHDIEAVCRPDVFFTKWNDFPPVRVGFGDTPAFNAGQFRVEIQFDAFPANNFIERFAIDETFFRRGVSQYMSGHGLGRVLANLFVAGEDRLAADSVQSCALAFGKLLLIDSKLQIGHGGLNSLPDFSWNAVLENDVEVRDRAALVVLPGAQRQVLEQIALFDLQQWRQGSRHFRLVLAEQDRIGVDGFDDNRGRQQVALDIQNVPSPRLEHVFLLSVLLSPGT